MKSDLVSLFAVHRQIFGICPRSGELFRLSDCPRIFRVAKRPQRDWMDRLEASARRLLDAEGKLEDEKTTLREAARVAGRTQARQVARRIDRVFTPRKLDPGDAKALLDPVDYIVFRGMKAGLVTGITLLDHSVRSKRHERLQISIRRTVEKGDYEWRTFRVDEEGAIRSAPEPRRR